MTQSIQEINARMMELDSVLKECELMINGRDSDFWQVLKRTYEAQVKSYRTSSRSAAESDLKSIRNFIGKEEGLEWAIDVVENDFLEQARRAKEELLQLREQLKELNDIDKGVESIIGDPSNIELGLL